ncbi:MAG: biotin/lipoyl-binding protein, partial [Gammaproteobacteria bacterium]
MSARVRGLAAAAALVLGAVGWYLWRSHGADDPNAALSLFGNVDVHQVELGFRVTGRIAEMTVQEGDRVKAGETLAQLDRVPFATDVAAARADVEQARAQLEKLRRGFRVEEIAAARATVAQ